MFQVSTNCKPVSSLQELETCFKLKLMSVGWYPSVTIGDSFIDVLFNSAISLTICVYMRNKRTSCAIMWPFCEKQMTHCIFMWLCFPFVWSCVTVDLLCNHVTPGCYYSDVWCVPRWRGWPRGTRTCRGRWSTSCWRPRPGSRERRTGRNTRRPKNSTKSSTKSAATTGKIGRVKKCEFGSEP